jgi:hypothetical protein
MQLITRRDARGRFILTGPKHMVLPPTTYQLEAALTRMRSTRHINVSAVEQRLADIGSLAELLYLEHGERGESFGSYLRRNDIQMDGVPYPEGARS